MNLDKLPHIGMRTVKTAIAVFASLFAAYLRGESATPLYIAFTAILCIQPTMENSKKTGFNRVAGTLIGGAWGSVIMFANMYMPNDIHILIHYFFTSVAIIPVIYTVLVLKKPEIIPITCTVYLCITVSKTPVTAPVIFVLNRLFDTITGIVLAMGVNSYIAPYTNKKQD